MSDTTRTTLRALGALGAATAGLSTFVSWYTFDVTVGVRGIATVFVVPVTLWDYAPIAGALIAAAALAGLAMLSLSEDVAPREIRIVAGVLGLAIAVYALIRCFDIPALGIPTGGGTRTDTSLDGGPFLALTGGLLQALGGLASYLGRRAEPAPAEPGRFERTGPAAEREAADRGASTPAGQPQRRP